MSGQTSAVESAIRIVRECVKAPGKTSIWSAELGRYICIDDPGYKKALAESAHTKDHPPISSTFKLVFLTAAIGTVLFISICVGVHLWTGGVMPSATEKLIDGLLDMAKIGFGAVVGLLGGQSLKSQAVSDQ